jgi:hypothetical protein
MEDHDDIETTLYRSEASILRGPGASAAAAATTVQLLSTASPPLSFNRRATTGAAPTISAHNHNHRYNSNGQQQQQLYWWWQRLQVATSLVVFWVGWRVPKAIMDRDDRLLSRPPPYQVTAAGDVVLDFALDEPLVDPPTISCTYPLKK